MHHRVPWHVPRLAALTVLVGACADPVTPLRESGLTSSLARAGSADPRVQRAFAIRPTGPGNLTIEIDPLRDDGLLLERALRRAGVPVERRVYDGVTHEFFGMAAVVRNACGAQDFAARRLRQAFNR